MSAILNIRLLAVLCLVYEIRSGRTYSESYDRLCETISQKATKQRLKLCGESRSTLREFRVRRGVNTTQKSTQAVKQVTSTKRPLSSYRFRTPWPTSTNGFLISAGSLNWTAKCTEDKNSGAAAITWGIPTPEPGRDECTGYYIIWDTATWGTFCDQIADKNVTSYIIDASKGWDGKEKLGISILPLPMTEGGTFTHRTFEPPSCSDPPFNNYTNTTKTNPTESNKGTSTDKNMKSETNSAKTTHATFKNEVPRPGKKNNASDKPVVNKLVFSIVITCIAIAILVLLLLFYKRRSSVNKIIRSYETHDKGAPHYVSYHMDNKSEIKNLARWLKTKKINAVIDILFTKTNPQAWSEARLLEAEKIIIVITSEYLKVCNLFHSEKNQKEKLSYNDQRCSNEISLIRNKLGENCLASDKFVGILVGTKKKDLPHWMLQLNCFEYKNGSLDEEILGKLKPCTYYNSGVMEISVD
ncbi:uncharacterized protein LOC114534157 [Dendronephthya gigantea]|uniref:uncharacterized protein LOC114534157 n=1 Tax=Dendronephthya gigantea TaxID=151771 RepID=UPI00106D88EB|nr:uncharacterized protein LOC114534157 [Dendronephthya gigantea]